MHFTHMTIFIYICVHFALPHADNYVCVRRHMLELAYQERTDCRLLVPQTTLLHRSHLHLRIFSFDNILHKSQELVFGLVGLQYGVSLLH